MGVWGLSCFLFTIETENQSGDVAGGNPSVLPLSAMLHVSGSRVPHRLGVRFRTQAHTRYIYTNNALSFQKQTNGAVPTKIESTELALDL